jgi:hypothetical protein
VHDPNIMIDNKWVVQVNMLNQFDFFAMLKTF